MARYLIDRHGRLWDPYDEQLLVLLGDPDPDYDILAYAVRNLGAIDVEVEAGRATLRLRRLTVTRLALEAVTDVLIRLPLSGVIIHCENEQRTEKSFASAPEAVAWIESNGVLTPGGGSQNLVATPRRIDALSERRLSKLDAPEDRLALIFKKWRMSQGKFNSDTGAFLIRFGLLDRTSVVSEAPDSRELIIEHAATSFVCYDNYDKSWNFLAQGKRLADQPDPNFGRWINDTYRNVLQQREPRFESVDAVVQPQGAEPYRFRYNRLLLPWQNERGMNVLTGTSYNEFAGRAV
jgi:hypothetical protein